MGRPKVKMNRAGSKALLRDAKTAAAMLSIAGKVQDGANSGITSAPDEELFQASVQVGKNRARASVITGGYASMVQNARTNALLKNLDRAR